jgi:hypothetical protein
MFAIDLLVRGTGYFSSSGFMFVASLCWLFLGSLASPVPRQQRSIHGLPPPPHLSVEGLADHAQQRL